MRGEDESPRTSALPIPTNARTRVRATGVARDRTRTLRVVAVILALQGFVRPGAALAQAGDTGVDAIRQIAVGALHACALLRSGTVYCWGEIGKELIHAGEGNSAVPLRVEGLPPVKSITAGQVNSCAIDRDDQAWCWGADYAATIAAQRAVTMPPTRIAGLPPVTQVAAGWTHVCAIAKSDGSVWCWGLNPAGELGNGTTTAAGRPVKASGIAGATAISAGVNNTCAVVARGELWCWGTDMQNGPGVIVRSDTPARVSGVSDVVAVSNGRNFVCTLSTARQVVCVGSNLMTQLGNRQVGRTFGVARPQRISQVEQIGSGMFGACALLADRTVSCWGVLSDFSDRAGVEPTTVSGLGSVSGLAVGLAGACAILDSGRAQCWGSNAAGQLGNGSTSTEGSSPPVAVVGLPPR